MPYYRLLSVKRPVNGGLRELFCVQIGLVPHELNEVIQGSHVWPPHVKKKKKKKKKKKRAQVTESVPSKLIGQKDLCPICLEELLEARRPGTPS
jgi:hypothetical protein